ncbi:MAG: sigma-70 family RNA polymerase sigma factor [Anaerolineae bacterium]|nr:sigma-70 family RNA polymerase sigma factor [Anaerolineae bacterium]
MSRDPYHILTEQYGEYLPRVLNYMRLRVDDEALAQDLTAQTFERALTRLYALRDEGAFGGWLFAIARTEVAGHYRRRKPQVSLDNVDGLLATDPSVEGRTERRQELGALCTALSTLSEREQEIVRLKFVAGLTNRAIGKVMRLREGNVAVILYRALRKLRSILDEREQ